MKALSAVLCAAVAMLSAVAQQPTHAAFQRGVAAMRSGQFAAAAEAFQVAVQQEPRSPEAWFNLGLVHDRLGRCSEAITDFQRALTLRPALHGANLFTGICEYRADRFADAAASFRAEVKLTPADANAWMWLGIDEMARKDHEAAVTALEQANRLKPNDADILYHRGRALLMLSRDSYSAMFAVDPNSWRVHQVLAQGFDESDHPVDASAEYGKAIELAPAEPGLHEALGTSLWQEGKLDDAEAAFRAELKIDPYNTAAQYKLGCLRIDRGAPAEGLPLLQTALQQDASLVTAHYYLGRAAAQTGHDQEAVQQFKTLLAATDDKQLRSQTFFQLARSYRRLKQPDDAQAALQQYQTLEDQLRSEQQTSLARRKALNTQEGENVPGPIPTER